MENLKKTRDDVIDIKEKIDALWKKAKNRRIHGDILNMIYHESNNFELIIATLTKIIGDCYVEESFR